MVFVTKDMTAAAASMRNTIDHTAKQLSYPGTGPGRQVLDPGIGFVRMSQLRVAV